MKMLKLQLILLKVYKLKFIHNFLGDINLFKTIKFKKIVTLTLKTLIILFFLRTIRLNAIIPFKLF